ncbi:MAG TPA: hypothetical protein VGJ84_12630 [Polyangiaceae bacterium]|jgi:hypothetical protein
MKELERRARCVRSSAVIRAWEYRQRRLAKGIWFRFRRVLAEASEAYAVPPEVMDDLVARGARLEPVGTDFEPKKRLVFLERSWAEKVPQRRAVALQLGPELLGERDLVLVAFDSPSVRS